MIVTSALFEDGWLKIATDQNTVADLDAYLDSTTEELYIKRILGNDLGAAFIADLTGTPSVPAAARFTAIFERFNWDGWSDVQGCSGVKNILAALFYYDYVAGQNVYNTALGNVSGLTEAAKAESLIKKSTIAYNRAVIDIGELRDYIAYNDDTYPEYTGYTYNFELLAA